MLRAIWLNLPTNALIADENTYVNAARVIAGLPVPAEQPFSGAPPGIDPQTDQPPLGKAMIAGSMLLLGDNPIGWRLPSLVMGMLALVALAGIVRRAGGSAWLSVLAVGILSLDNLVFVHSRIATPDMPMLAVALVGAWFALGRQWALAAAAFAIATLIKPIAIFAVFAVLLDHAIDIWRARRRDGAEPVPFTAILPSLRLVGFYAVMTFAGLWVLDAIFVRGIEPFGHLLQIAAAGFAGSAGTKAPDIAAPVWLWAVNERQFDYIHVAANTIVDGEVTVSRSIIRFQAALNPAFVGTAMIATVWTAWRALREEDRLAQWATAWIGATAGAWLLIGLFANRATFLYHSLVILPGIAVATAVLLLRSPLPRAVAWGYLVLLVIGFLAYFPFREIPPPP